MMLRHRHIVMVVEIEIEDGDRLFADSIFEAAVSTLVDKRPGRFLKARYDKALLSLTFSAMARQHADETVAALVRNCDKSRLHVTFFEVKPAVKKP